MKSRPQPCPRHRESVALLASSTLDAGESSSVRAHLQGCPACRHYFAELSAICAEQSGAGQALPAVAVRPALYRRVAAAIRVSPPGPAAPWLAAWPMRPLSFAGAAALLLACLGGWALLRPAPAAERPQAKINAIQTVRPYSPGPAAVVSPQFLAYRLALNRSPEAFERMLSAEEARPAHSEGPPVLRNLARSEAGF
jgi:anti-sigma factor RsiW